MKKIKAIGIGIGNAGRKIGCDKAPYSILNQLKDTIIDANIYNYVYGKKVKTMGKYFNNIARIISNTLNEGNFPLAIGGDHSCAIATWSGVYDYLKYKKKN